MNTIESSPVRAVARYTLRSAVLTAIAAFALAASASAQTVLINDTFDGPTVNTGLWANGSTGSSGITTFNSGSVTLDTNLQTTARNALLSNRTDINPFASTLTVSLNGLSLAGTPDGNPISLYAVVGHLPTDTGGPATGALASTYSTGGGGYYTSGGTGGALGLSVLIYGTGSIQLQVLDSGGVAGVGSVGNGLGANRVITGVPTDIVWTIDGQAGTFSVTLTGATFTTGAEAGKSTINGTFTRFTEATLDSSGTSVSRLAIGSFNTGSSIIDGGSATFGSVSVQSAAIPEPSTFALVFSVIVGVGVAGRRGRRAA